VFGFWVADLGADLAADELVPGGVPLVAGDQHKPVIPRWDQRSPGDLAQKLD
jgi:hypothetical protein